MTPSDSIPPKILGAMKTLGWPLFQPPDPKLQRDMRVKLQPKVCNPHLRGISDIVVAMGCHDGHGNAGTSTHGGNGATD